MGEILGWLASYAVALVALALGHDVVAACALAAAAAGALVVRRNGPLVDGLEALAVAATGITLAAASRSPALVVAAITIAFSAIVQQYAALVYAHIVRRREAPLGAPLGFAVTGGLAAFLALGRPLLLLVGLATWAIVDCAWSAIARGIALRAPVTATTLPPLRGRARWQRLGEGIAASRDTAFWGLVVARPIARALLYVVAEVRWLTPNLVTLASIACCFAAAVLIALGGHVVLAVALIGVRSVLDSLDGQLARYRACGTSFGSYLDKVSDLFAWGALFAALGIRAFTVTASLPMLVLPLVAAIVLALSGFALWLSRALAPQHPVTPPPAQLGLAAWAKSLWRIVLFEEPDFYLWIALAVVTARFDIFVPLIAGGHVARALVVAVARAGSRLVVGKESPA